MLLHHVEGFQDDNLRAAQQNRAALGLCNGLVERIGFDDRVTAGYTQLRAIAHAAVARDGFRLSGGGITAIDERAAELAEPARSGLHDGCLFLFSLRHPAAAVE